MKSLSFEELTQTLKPFKKISKKDLLSSRKKYRAGDIDR
jgi:hypothetical protein